MKIQLLACPHCGAPLSFGTRSEARGELWPCLHCDAVLRVKDDAAPIVERQIPPDLTSRLRQLVIEGKTAEARELAVGVGLGAEVVDRLSSEITSSAFFGQGLNRSGALVLLAAVIGVIAGGLLLDQGRGVGWLFVVAGLFIALVLVRPLVTSIKLVRSASGVAAILRVTHLGSRPPKPPVEIFAFAVEVSPSDGSAAFVGTVLVPVRASSLAKAVVGTRVVVRYDREDRQWIRYDRMA